LALQIVDARILGKRCRANALRGSMKIGRPVVLPKGRQCDGSGVGI
jgi:hypothetical protein